MNFSQTPALTVPFLIAFLEISIKRTFPHFSIFHRPAIYPRTKETRDSLRMSFVHCDAINYPSCQSIKISYYFIANFNKFFPILLRFVFCFTALNEHECHRIEIKEWYYFYFILRYSDTEQGQENRYDSYAVMIRFNYFSS